MTYYLSLKSLEKFYSMMIFSRSLTEAITIEKPKNPQNNPEI